ncbi:MAG TPA: EAL domain-containing protein [Solirubrobacteraceae bacterium]|nr:EAL domain-containing protein [Solirubrobacteraceae bacterium]
MAAGLAPGGSAELLLAPVLIVDDDPRKRLSIHAMLAPLGHEIVEAACGEEALHAVMARTFAVILMDVQMPGMDGYETARLIRLRRECEHTPIIFITAGVEDVAQIPIAYASGAVDFMVGAITPAVLRAKVSVFVELFLKSLELERSLGEVTFVSEQFRDSEAHARAVLHNVGDGIVTLSDDGLVESFNRAASRLFGYSEAEAIGQPFAGMIPPTGRAGRSDPSAGSLGTRKDGSSFPVEQNLSQVQLGTRTVHILCVRDISEREAYTDALRHQTLHDALTGLPNRVLFRERLSHAVSRSVRTGEPLALFLVDLDDFKHVNDTIGHENGDVLLRLLSARLVGCLRESDTVARLGGDEFAILPIEPTNLPAAATVAWKVQAALEAPFVCAEHSVQLAASIGMALLPEHGHTVDDLMRRADLALYDAKRHQSKYAIFTAEQEQAPARRLALLDNLRHCVERDELVLHYQPKIDLTTGEATGLEALIRWNHPSGRLFSPDQFIPEIESNELMISITRWVINEALRKLRLLRDEGFDLTMAVNLGARCLEPDAGLLESVGNMTTAWGIAPDKLTLELTESALIDTALPELLERLQSVDQRLSIDDFGTGYSSLVYLQRLPVVEVKADRSFVMTMASVESDAVIVRSIVDLAHNLSVKVVAEGVEDEKTMNMLLEYGCDEAQGYHFARPMPGPELADWLQTSPFSLPRRLPVATPTGGNARRAAP